MFITSAECANWYFWSQWGNWSNFPGSSAILMPSLASAPLYQPKRVADSVSLGEECSVAVTILCHEPASRRGLGVQRFLEGSGVSEQARVHYSSLPGQVCRAGLPVPRLSWCGLGLIQPSAFHQIYSHWIPQKLTADVPQALSRFVFGPGHTQVFLQSLEGEREWISNSENGQSGKVHILLPSNRFLTV